MPDVVIIGGGLLGAALAYRLTGEGANVTIVEADRLGAGAAHVSFAWLNASNKPPLPYHLLNVSGMAEYHRLRAEFGPTPWLHLDGHVEWDRGDGGPERLRQKVARLQGWGYAADLLPVRELRVLEPDLAGPPDLSEFAYYPDEGYIDPVQLIGVLAGAARDAGAEILVGQRVTGLLRAGDRVTGVETAHGERITADRVVSCAGRWSDKIARLAGLDLPLAPTVGLVAVSGPSTVRLRAVHHDETMNIRPDGAGRIMMRHADFDVLAQPEMPLLPVPAFCHDLFARVLAVLPGLAGTTIEAVRVTLRPIPRDGVSVIGPAPGVPGLYLIVTHSAVTMGPLLGRLAAREIVAGTVDPRLQPFRPERLVGSANH